MPVTLFKDNINNNNKSKIEKQKLKIDYKRFEF